jgi:hypothetical protein
LKHRLTRCPQAAAPQHGVFLLQKSQEQDQEIAQASQLLERVASDSDAKYDQAIAGTTAATRQGETAKKGHLVEQDSIYSLVLRRDTDKTNDQNTRSDLAVGATNKSQRDQ